jgi:predicted nucleic acid-binding Zn ribbon protein
LVKEVCDEISDKCKEIIEKNSVHSRNAIKEWWENIKCNLLCVSPYRRNTEQFCDTKPSKKIVSQINNFTVKYEGLNGSCNLKKNIHTGPSGSKKMFV